MKITMLHNEPEIKIDIQAWLKMCAYTQISPYEIGWLGTVERTGNIYTITDVFLVKQEVDSTTCELDPESIISLYEDRTANNLSVDNILLWGHSHVDMSPNPSGQDSKQFDEFYNNNPYFIRLIMNKKHDVHLSILDADGGMLYEEVPYTLLGLEDAEMESIKDEINSKTTKKVRPQYPQYAAAGVTYPAYEGIEAYTDSGYYYTSTGGYFNV